MTADTKLIEARKDIEEARRELAERKEAAKLAKEMFDAANDRFLKLFDEANDLNLFNTDDGADDRDDD